MSQLLAVSWGSSFPTNTPTRGLKRPCPSCHPTAGAALRTTCHIPPWYLPQDQHAASCVISLFRQFPLLPLSPYLRPPFFPWASHTSPTARNVCHHRSLYRVSAGPPPFQRTRQHLGSLLTVFSPPHRRMCVALLRLHPIPTPCYTPWCHAVGLHRVPWDPNLFISFFLCCRHALSVTPPSTLRSIPSRSLSSTPHLTPHYQRVAGTTHPTGRLTSKV